jgi:hypothetical protein
MSDYLRRVATSAARKATTARPAGSAPPLLPPSMAWLAPLQEAPSSDEPFVKPTISPRQDTFESSTQETAAPSSSDETAAEANTEPRGAQAVRPAIAANIKAPFTVQLPKTLRPVAHTQAIHTERSANQALPSSTQPTSAHVPTAAITPARNEQSNQQLVQASEQIEASEQMATTPGEEARVTSAAPVQLTSAVPVQSRARETSTSAVPPAEPELLNVPQHEAPMTAAAHIALPPQPAPIVRLPPALSDASAQRQMPRITVGRLEVLVNNHPPASAASPPAPRPPSNGTEPFERRYLDRFRLRP